MEEVKAIIEKKPEFVSCISTPPPKKEQGQSPLQVAIKVDAFDIAYYLIEKGADVNFMEITFHIPRNLVQIGHGF